MQISPSPVLSGIVRHFLFIGNRSKEVKRFRFFSDGSPGMVFTLSGQLTESSFNGLAYPANFVYGQLTHYLDVFAEADTKLLIALFHPAAMSLLLKNPAFMMTDQVMEMNAILENDLKTGTHFLLGNTVQKNIRMIETFILKNLVGRSSEKLQIVYQALGEIRLRTGNLAIEELSAVTGCHRRNLERLFREYVGLSPKKLCTVNRIHNFIREARQETAAAKFTSGALSSGYFDQAHLNHEFKLVTGVTPSAYFHNRECLAVNFFGI